MAQIEDALVVRMEASLAKFEKQMARGKAVAASTSGEIERRFDNTNRKLAKSSDSAAKGLSRVINIGGQGRFVLQNTAAQFGDIAVQMEQGTAATRVLGQQLPQILGGFGALGGALGIVAPLLGTVAAVGLPLAGMFFALGGDAEEASEKVKTFEEKLDAARGAMERAAAAAAMASAGGLDDLKAKYGEVTIAVTELADALADIERRAAAVEIKSILDPATLEGFGAKLSEDAGRVGSQVVNAAEQEIRGLEAQLDSLQTQLADTLKVEPDGNSFTDILTAQITKLQQNIALLKGDLDSAGDRVAQLGPDADVIGRYRQLRAALSDALDSGNFSGAADAARDLRALIIDVAGEGTAAGDAMARVEDLAREAANRLGEAEANAGGVASAASGIVGPVSAAADEAARLSGNLASAMANLASVTAGMAAAQRRAAAQARIARDFAGDPVGRAGAETRAELNEASGSAAYELIRSGGAARLGNLDSTADRLVEGAENVARLEQEAEAAESAAKEAAREAAKAASGGGSKGRTSGGKSGRKASGGSGRTGSKGKTETPFFENVEGEIQGLQRRIEMIGKTRSEVAELEARYRLLDEAKERGLELDQKQADTGETLAQQIDRQAAAVGNLTAQYEQAEQRAQFFSDVQTTLQDGFIDAIVAGEDFAGVLSNVAQMLAKAALQAALFGSGPTGTGTGLLSGVMGGVFGGFRAAGGPVMGGKSYVVGENGPELFTAPHGGKIVPNHALGGGQGGGIADVRVSIDQDGNLQAFVERVSNGASQRNLAAYDRGMPGRVKQIQKDPRAR